MTDPLAVVLLCLLMVSCGSSPTSSDPVIVCDTSFVYLPGGAYRDRFSGDWVFPGLDTIIECRYVEK